ncbi:uncharacterized protein (DUF1810 family) [Stella humosa]|uniref:Uncharacterized protein (DUF1810 family) n=1 Tax=Stella humosa TaxID=94 RepID=A0A3N1KX10_9PROT|nr:DUF1810 domain-containing protein [Stella humosa]ROP83140.1 uncharacterized protein (DUF1810 family) [Stella humosa]BBK30083.1 hypothetical protein STHU_07170 [Stella humosa]
MTVTDPFDLARFESAQAPSFATALGELQAGRKRSHWMWFVFPQLRGLGQSAMAWRYGIASLDEARAYLAHPILGPRLRQCTQAMLAIPEGSATAILGTPDDMKFCSCMTLFAAAADAGDGLFSRALDRYCAGKADSRTLALLASAGPS